MKTITLREHGILVTLALALTISLSGCASTPAAAVADLRGSWGYQLIDTNNNTWDQGTLEVTGGLSEGTWTRVDFYGTPDTGTWATNGDTFVVSGGLKAEGSLRGSRELKGTWSAANGDHGELILKRK